MPCSGYWGLQSGWACALFWLLGVAVGVGLCLLLTRLTHADMGVTLSRAIFSYRTGTEKVVGMKVPRDLLSKLSGSLNFRECNCPGKPASWAAGVSQAGCRPCSIRHLLAGCRHIVFHCHLARKTNCLPLSPNQPTFSAALPPLSCFLSKGKL